jgi:hypothetical protein
VRSDLAEGREAGAERIVVVLLDEDGAAFCGGADADAGGEVVSEAAFGVGEDRVGVLARGAAGAARGGWSIAPVRTWRTGGQTMPRRARMERN